MSTNRWKQKKQELGIDPLFTRGKQADYYMKRTQIEYMCDEGERAGSLIWETLNKSNTSDRSPIYKALLGTEGFWRQKTLSYEEDPECLRIVKMIQKFFKNGEVEYDDTGDSVEDNPSTEQRNALLQLKVNGVSMILIFELIEPGKNKYKLRDVRGKQGPFDGLNARNAAFREIVEALLADFTIELPEGVVPEGTQAILVQAELAKGLTNCSHKEVCANVMSYGEDKSMNNRMEILKGLRLYVFNACIFTLSEGIRSESVETIPLRSINEFLKHCRTLKPPHFPDCLKICPFGYFQSLDDAKRIDEIKEFCKTLGVEANGEGFVITFEMLVDGKLRVIKYKAKIVYSKNKGFAVEIANGILLALYHPSGGLAGIVCAPMVGDNKCKQMIVTETCPRPFPKRENKPGKAGVVWTGSLTFSAGDQLDDLCEKAEVVPHHMVRNTKLQHHKLLSIGAGPGGEPGMEYMVTNSVLEKYVPKFLNIVPASGARSATPPKCVMFYKGNQFINEKYFDTLVFMGIFIQEEYDFPSLIETLQGEEDLLWEVKIKFRSMCFTDLPFDYSKTSEFIEQNLSTFGLNPDVRVVKLQQFHSYVGAWYRNARKNGGVPKKRIQFEEYSSNAGASAPKKQRTAPRPSTVKDANIRALEMAYEDTGGIVKTMQNLGNLMNSHIDAYSLHLNLITEKLCKGQNLTSAEKGALTTEYKKHRQDFISWMNREEAVFRHVVEGRDEPPPSKLVPPTPPTVLRQEAMNAGAAGGDDDADVQRSRLLRAAEARRLDIQCNKEVIVTDTESDEDDCTPSGGAESEAPQLDAQAALPVDAPPQVLPVKAPPQVLPVEAPLKETSPVEAPPKPVTMVSAAQKFADMLSHSDHQKSQDDEKEKQRKRLQLQIEVQKAQLDAQNAEVECAQLELSLKQARAKLLEAELKALKTKAKLSDV